MELLTGMYIRFGLSFFVIITFIISGYIIGYQLGNHYIKPEPKPETKIITYNNNTPINIIPPVKE